jgi:hypothetical protein
MGISALPWKAISPEAADGTRAIDKEVSAMEDPGITRLDIDRYRRSLNLNLDAATRAKTLELIAEAEARLAALRRREQPRMNPVRQPPTES